MKKTALIAGRECDLKYGGVRHALSIVCGLHGVGSSDRPGCFRSDDPELRHQCVLKHSPTRYATASWASLRQAPSAPDLSGFPRRAKPGFIEPRSPFLEIPLD